MNPIVIGSNTIERVMTYKLLGVYVSNDLKWNHHVEVIVQKGNRRLYSLRVLKGAMSPHTHARANENKLKKSARLFQVVSEILEGCFYLSKS